MTVEETDRVIERDTDRLDGESEGMWINDKLHLSYLLGCSQSGTKWNQKFGFVCKIRIFWRIIKIIL